MDRGGLMMGRLFFYAGMPNPKNKFVRFEKSCNLSVLLN